MAQTLLDWLHAEFPTAKNQTLKRMVEAGRVRVNDQPARRLSLALSDSDRVAIAASAAAAARTSAAPSPIIYEDSDLLVVNKPAGLLTSTGPRERRPTLLARVQHHFADDRRVRVGLIHRLDRDASGLLVFSKNDVAYQSLKTQFFHHHVERIYAAVVRGVPRPRQGRIESRLHERADGTVYSTGETGKGESAVTHYEVIRADGRLALVRVTLHTGRKHQIRVHLKEQGTPIVGDRIYAAPDSSEPRLLLTAFRLAITHPQSDEPMTFDLGIPADFEARVAHAPRAKRQS